MGYGQQSQALFDWNLGGQEVSQEAAEVRWGGSWRVEHSNIITEDIGAPKGASVWL